MSKNLIENDEYTLTRFCSEKGKLGYQITQKILGRYNYVQIAKKDIQNMLKAIKEDE